MGEFLVPTAAAAFPLLTLWEQGAGQVRWFSSETIMCWFTARGRAVHSHRFLLTGKWLSGLPNGGSVWETDREVGGGRESDGWCERWWYLRSECHTVCCIPSWDLEDMGEWAERAGELRRDGSLFFQEKHAAKMPFIFLFSFHRLRVVKLFKTTALEGLHERIYLFNIQDLERRP